MENNILSLVEKAKESPKYYNELSQLIQINLEEIPYFIDQYLLFEYLGNYAKSEYVNFFYSLDRLLSLDIIFFELQQQKHQKYTFYKCISIYVLQKMKNNNVILLDIQRNEIAKIYIEILKLIPTEKFDYKNEINRGISYENITEILKYAKNIKESYNCGDIWSYYLNDLKEFDFIPLIELTEKNLDTILNYSRKYPNRIQKLEVYDIKWENELSEIIKLNRESLTYSAYYDLYHIAICKHLTGISSGTFIEELPENIKKLCDFPKLQKLEIYFPSEIVSYSPKEKQMFVKINLAYFNIFPNLTHLHFIGYRLDIDVLLLFLFGLKSKKLRTIKFTGRINDYALDFDPIIQHFPELESIQFSSINQELDCIFNVYHGHFTEIDYPNLEKLIRNYLNTHPNNKISFQIESESFLILDYFQYKTNLHDRIQKIEYSYELIEETLRYKKGGACNLKDKFDISFYSHFENIDIVRIEEEIELTDEELIEFLLKIKPYVIFYYDDIITNALRQFLKHKSNVKIIYNCMYHKLFYAEKIFEENKEMSQSTNKKKNFT